MGLIARVIATLFGIGYFPVASGTVSCAVIWVVLWLLPPIGGYWVWVGIPVLFFVGVWVSSVAEKKLGHDAHPIIIDEAVSMWLVLSLLPKGWLLWGIGFVLLRAFDVLKPFPVRNSQELPKGWGIMIDDILAAGYTIVIVRLGMIAF
jgi:phosphatidylglycerophosphatase A